MNRPTIRGRDAATVAADVATIRQHVGDVEAAQSLWTALDFISRSASASPYTRRRAEKAAIALGSLLDDITDADAAEQAFTWNDPPETDEQESPWPWDLWDGPRPTDEAQQ